MAMIVPDSPFDLMRQIREESFRCLVVLICYYSELEACQILLEALQELAEVKTDINFVKVDLNTYGDAREYFKLESVPTILLYQSTVNLARIEGADVPQIISQIESHHSNWATKAEEIQRDVYERLNKLVRQEKIMMFIKGSPDTPKCKFTRKLMGIVQGQQFGHFDILEDDTVREWMKKFSNWPTFPQVYVNGEFIGGVDIIEEMHKAGELTAAFSG